MTHRNTAWTTKRRRALFSAAAASAALALVPVAARAVDDTKPGAGCAGLAFVDPPGDQTGPDGQSPGLATLDVTGGFFRYRNGELTANIVVRDLSTALRAPETREFWQMRWTQGSTEWYLRADAYRQDGVGNVRMYYTYGTVIDDVGPGGVMGEEFRSEGITQGKLFTGKDGVIQIVVPAAAGAAATSTLKAPYAESGEHNVPAGGQVPGSLERPSDLAPDSRIGADYVVGACGDGATATAPGGGTVPSPGATTEPNALPFKASASLSAKKLRKSKAITLKVASTKRITGLKVRLNLRGSTGKLYASGSLASLDGKGRLKLRLKSRLKPGRYALVASGKVGGKTLGMTIFLTVRE
jgi:hypothetical protein